MTLLTQVTPPLTGYGLALWDENETFLTAFDNNTTVLREVARGYFDGNENTTLTVKTTAGGLTDMTLLSGIDTANSIVLTTYRTGSGWAQTNTAYISGNKVYVRPTGTTTTNRAGSVSVQQYREATPTAQAYGLEVKNGDNDIVLDCGAAVWSVKYRGTLPAMQYWTQYGTDDPYTLGGGGFDEYAQYRVLNLTASTYSTSKPFAVAVKCNHDVYIIQPYIFANSGGFYTQVVFHAPMFDPDVIDPVYSYAILVSPFDFEPNEYGTDYGMELFDASGYKFWSSKWRQAIIQKLININIFDTGVDQNGTYDYETGHDGVTAAPIASSPSDPYSRALHTSTGEVEVVSCNIDPKNTYVMFWAGNGKVDYNQSEVDDIVDGQAGGGQHWPAVRIKNGGTSIDLKMHRTARGPTGTYGARVATSFHPTGYVGLVRII